MHICIQCCSHYSGQSNTTPGCLSFRSLAFACSFFLFFSPCLLSTIAFLRRHLQFCLWPFPRIVQFDGVELLSFVASEFPRKFGSSIDWNDISIFYGGFLLFIRARPDPVNYAGRNEKFAEWKFSKHLVQYYKTR